MQPSEITAHEIENMGPKFLLETRIDSFRHLPTGADILAKPGLGGALLSWRPGLWPAYRALKQSVGIAFGIERAQRLDSLSRCFPEVRLVNSFTGRVARSLIFFNNIIQLPQRYVMTRKVKRIIKKCHRLSGEHYRKVHPR
ncbi:MAG TPA: hypothetical protein VKG22_06940 [Stellaceae bacterium]|nr:hypothetical protein [Stellaceae bacterium]